MLTPLEPSRNDLLLSSSIYEGYLQIKAATRVVQNGYLQTTCFLINTWELGQGGLH